MQARQVAALAEARKKADARIAGMTELMNEQAGILSKVEFEIKTTQKIEQRRKDSALASLREAHSQGLFNRRQALAKLLNSEFETWSKECTGIEETMEVRKARLMQKAYALRDRREQERREFAKQAYETAWRDGCDDLRDLDGKALTTYMSKEREKQIQEKKERKALEEIQANSFYEEWTKQLDALAAADDKKKWSRNNANMQTAEGLREQIAYNAGQRMDTYSRAMADAQAEIDECNAAIAAERAKEQARKTTAVERGKEVMSFNTAFQQQSKERSAVEAQQDAILLNNALKLEREQIDRENKKRQEGAEAARQYRKYLEELMVKEAEDTGFVDEMNRREAEKVQKARDDALQARQDARDYLMKKVAEGRREQILYKQALGVKEKEEGKIFAAKFLEDLRVGVEQDRAASAGRRDRNLENNVKLNAQIADKERQRELSKQEVFLEDKRMQLIEKKHRARLEAQGGVVRLYHPKIRPDTR